MATDGDAGAAALVRSGGPLAAAICRFNLDPAATLHPSWVPILLPEPGVASLLLQPRARLHLSKLVLERTGMAGTWCFAMDGVAARLALIEGPALARLIAHAGIALHARAVAGVIDGPAVARLRAALGTDGHGFALRGAPLLVGPSLRPLTSESTDPAEMARSGTSAFVAATSGLGAAVLGRLRLKLPYEQSRRAAPPPETAAPAAGLFRNLVREVAPAWWWLFS